jgi:hypothetical protein
LEGAPIASAAKPDFSPIIRGDVPESDLISDFLIAAENENFERLVQLAPSLSIVELHNFYPQRGYCEPWIVQEDEIGPYVGNTCNCASAGLISRTYRLGVANGRINSAELDDSRSMLEC